MMYLVLYSQAAYSDLKNVYNYITYDLLEPIVAGNLIKKIENAVASLSMFPWRHQKCESSQIEKEERRQFSLNGYAIIYEIDERNKTVKILRIVCERRNIRNTIN